MQLNTHNRKPIVHELMILLFKTWHAVCCPELISTFCKAHGDNLFLGTFVNALIVHNSSCREFWYVKEDYRRFRDNPSKIVEILRLLELCWDAYWLSTMTGVGCRSLVLYWILCTFLCVLWMTKCAYKDVLHVCYFVLGLHEDECVCYLKCLCMVGTCKYL